MSAAAPAGAQQPAQNANSPTPPNVSRSSSRSLNASQHTVSSIARSTHGSTAPAGHHTPSHALPASAPPVSSIPSSTSTTINKETGSGYKISWWWWWELGAAMLSMAAVFSIIIILAKFQDRPLEEWTLNIQINSLIATLTTVGKTAMLVAVAESISQLKWLHFYQRSAPLDIFQDFDDASRGPWGSATLLWSTNFKAILASLGAVITICGLAIEPMAQQVLDFPPRNVTLTNATSSIGIANAYYSRAFQGSGDSTADLDVTGVVGSSTALLDLQSLVINGVVGRVVDVNMTCPLAATECRWPAFTTLGVCGMYHNITNYGRNCTDYNPTLICDYTSPDFPQFSNLRDHAPDDWSVIRMLYDSQNTPQNNWTWLFSTFVDYGYRGIVSVKAKDKVTRDENGTRAPRVDIEHISWDYCIRDYKDVTASGRTLLTNSFTSEPAHLVDRVDVPDEPGSALTKSWLIYNGNNTGREIRIEVNTDVNLWGHVSVPSIQRCLDKIATGKT